VKAPYLKAFLASLPTGAVIGLAFGFSVRGSRTALLNPIWWRGNGAWLADYPADAIFWLVAGAFVAGKAVYIWQLLHSN